jgi:hypothetical protein
MSERQLDFDENNDMLYIPGFLLNKPSNGAIRGSDMDIAEDDFLKNAKGWSECNFTDDCFE